ncbi:flagellar hook-basal body complex protein FliE [Leptospirillum ferrooxidans]|jgi:flagellar hook-basal body complex protein FliE|uniref:Flagellar hook-basal body complex protein FliE n=1 Tax=Leptospirillum ferrooxidans (strain C2-3) TaxID=1162668 RepID=I0IL42_LEPFC|nr:flagellar hook-basal body complex protein FliE [Leptospirillum ferrooxidans]BAM05991.1 flagellar hook-basal body complex subunit [Leptospirillum ferrooxidans C2-3]
MHDSNPIYNPLAGFKGVPSPSGSDEISGRVRPHDPEKSSLATPESSFVNVLKDSISKVNAIQVEADKTIQDYSTGKNNVTLHQTMVEMAQADVSFQLMMQVRDKIVRAYQEMMNMPM